MRIGREIAEALAEAHSRKLIHRDIKPANIWLEGASGWVKLVDFGLAHAAEDVHLTQTGAILGTPAYMSPEQARGEAVDGRTDLYSLGAVLYKLTTGEVPFRGASTMAVLMALATETPRPPIGLNPDIPPALNDLILRLLAKKPNERYESAAAVAEAIREIEASRVGIAHLPAAEAAEASGESGTQPLAPGEQCPPYGRRPRWPLAAAGAAALFLFAAVVVSVRDKHGNEVFRGTVPEGGSLTVTDAAGTSKVDPALGDGGDNRLREGQRPSPPRSVGATLPEPPPLKDWLKGRTALTVAQDGSGQFKTIQEALKALKPHQVVKVLDAGPYRETLHVDGLPDDTGLIGLRQATVELAAWPDTPPVLAVVMGHTLNAADGFRLSGLRFVAPSRDDGPGTARMLQLTRFSGLVVEDCYFGWAGEHDLSHYAQLLSFTNDGGTGTSPVVVRHCMFDSGHIPYDESDWAWPGALVVERNYFKNAGFSIDAPQVHDVQFLHNVLSGKGASCWVNRLKKITGTLVISNNTALLGGFLMFKDAPASGVTLRNNLTEQDAALGEEADTIRAEIAKNWRRDHNGYTVRKYLPKSPGDVTDASGYLSSDPSARDFARIAEVGALARGGAGGDWPTYIGALPPGPAPKDGDWFTRLRERWQTDAPSDASLPRKTINVLAMLDLSKDLVPIANLTGANKWTKSADKLTYHSDGHSGKIVAPIDLADARDFVIQVDVRRLSGDSVFTLDFPTSATLGRGLDVFIGGQIELKLENGQRHKIGEWPDDVKDGGQLFLRVRKETATRAGSVEVTVNGRRAAHWEGNVSKIGNPLESHPAFPGRMTVGMFCYKDSYEFTAWWLRVFESQAQPLRTLDNGN